jgi:hypothetical protein
MAVMQGEGFFDGFSVLCGMVHVLYGFCLVFLVVSLAIVFGYTGSAFMAPIGLAMLPVGWLASRPEDDEDAGLTLP